MTSALLAPVVDAVMQAPPVSSNTYDLAELRLKLEQRMEYATMVKTLPHDTVMDPDESVPSYASSTEVAERV